MGLTEAPFSGLQVSARRDAPARVRLADLARGRSVLPRVRSAGADARFEIAPYDFAAAERAAAASSASRTRVAQVLARRGLGDPARRARWLAADVRHPLDAFGGLATAPAAIVGPRRRGARITVHGDYDVDGVCSTAILVRALRTLGADVDWYLPSRTEDGYGLAAATVERLAARGTELLVTADCAITAVDEVAAARAAGIDVVVTDHHAPRADGALPDAPIVHPRLGGYPCPDLCAAGVAYKLAARAARGGAGATRRPPTRTSTSSRSPPSPTSSRCTGENRRLVRAGLSALARTRKPGLRALMRVAQRRPERRRRGRDRLPARAAHQRRRPPVPRRRRARAAAHRRRRARAGDRRGARPRQRASAATSRRASSSRPRRSWRASVGDPPALRARGRGLAPGRDRDRRLADRRALLPPDRADRARRRARAPARAARFPASTCSAASTRAPTHLLRHGGHRAAAGLTIARDRVDALPRGVRRPRRRAC